MEGFRVKGVRGGGGGGRGLTYHCSNDGRYRLWIRKKGVEEREMKTVGRGNYR